MGKWGNGEMAKWADGDMGNWGTEEGNGEMGKRRNGEMGPCALGTTLLVQKGSNTGIIMRACTYTKSCLSNSGACGYSRLTSLFAFMAWSHYWFVAVLFVRSL